MSAQMSLPNLLLDSQRGMGADSKTSIDSEASTPRAAVAGVSQGVATPRSPEEKSHGELLRSIFGGPEGIPPAPGRPGRVREKSKRLSSQPCKSADSEVLSTACWCDQVLTEAMDSGFEKLWLELVNFPPPPAAFSIGR
eukprot:TRINITY_DN98332_c0_g1_i1.p2 TRINITY_DN98332_c0_g1~~TRINITY_DN98332_c0_g1_i1.p2  ORF type:complete len:139 (+),score=18.29 TRINITY_DN98332_c0_g1_i1:46-462(+)